MIQANDEFPVTGHYQVKPNGHMAPESEGVDLAPRSLYEMCVVLQAKLEAFLAEEPKTELLRSVQERLRASIDLVDEALEKYRLEQIALSWNGGKDCLVLLVVLLASIARRFAKSDLPNGSAKSPSFPDKLRSIYIVSAHPFPEVDAFVEATSLEYHLDTARFMCKMREGLEAFLQENPKIEAIFIGVRRTDPHGDKLKYFDPTDSGWPAVMRLHPILDWRLAEIWAFIRHLEIPYCSLYDQGYTSLGGKYDTHPNPRLKKEGAEKEDGKVGDFRPAYELVEDDEERLGRY